jgi:hypothetical protein
MGGKVKWRASLALRDAYVEAYGGQLWSEPHPTGGTPDETRFTFQISLAHKSAVTVQCAKPTGCLQSFLRASSISISGARTSAAAGRPLVAPLATNWRKPSPGNLLHSPTRNPAIGVIRVRSGLAAGGRWIRTLGPPSEGCMHTPRSLPIVRTGTAE